MEFDVMIHGFCPRNPHDPAHEHDWVRRELELVQAADRAGFKYVWLTEHHFLEEHSPSYPRLSPTDPPNERGQPR